MKRAILIYLLLTSCLFSGNHIFSQTNDSVIRKKALYKNFAEFVTNKTSLTDSFVVKYFSKAKNDSSLVCAKCFDKYGLPMAEGLWGFCDGSNVFIRLPQSILKNDNYFKLDYIGSFCFFEAPLKANLYITPFDPVRGIVASATNAVITPKQTITYMLDNNGNVKPLTEERLRKYMKAYPALLTSFNKDFEKVFPKEFYSRDHEVTDEEELNRMNVLKEYLIKLSCWSGDQQGRSLLMFLFLFACPKRKKKGPENQYPAWFSEKRPD